MWRLRNHYWREKAISITYSVCVCVCVCVSVASVIQHAMLMHRVILSPVSSPTLHHFSTLSHKRHGFREKCIENKMRVLILCTTVVWNISHSNKNSARCHKCTNFSLQNTFYSCQSLIKSDFLDPFWRNAQISDFMKIRPVGAELFHTDRRTDRHDDYRRFSRFCKRA